MPVRDEKHIGLFCVICSLNFFTKEEFNLHRATNEHRVKWINRKYTINRKQFVGSRNGITVDASCEDVNVHLTVSKETSTIEAKIDEEEVAFKFIIRNGTSNDSFYIRGIDIVNKIVLIENSLDISVDDAHDLKHREKVLVLKPGKKYEFECKIIPTHLLKRIRTSILVELSTFENVNSLFHCGLDLVLVPAASTQFPSFGNYVPGVPLKVEGDDLEKHLPLYSYDIEEKFFAVACNNEKDAIHQYKHTNSKLVQSIHRNFFTILLWLEELQIRMDVQYYSQKNVHLKLVAPNVCRTAKICHELEVDGLSENRPCIMERDKVYVKDSSSTPTADVQLMKYYEGIVHKVLDGSVYLAFHSSFAEKYNVNRTTFDVEFSINRYPFRVGHRALYLCMRNSLYNFVFPRIPSGPCPMRNAITPYNSNISNNYEQQHAVEHIVDGSSKPAPFLIFGPPGTGKTMTVVEAIKQVLHKHRDSHVLACAPSNTAADIIAERLLETLNEQHLFRMYAMSRSSFKSKCSEKLLKASNLNGDYVYLPSKEILEGKRVIVCTFVMAARIAAANFDAGHFTHVILDEAGHAVESEALVAIGNILARDGQLVLAGDPHQLGPIVRSFQATGGKQIFTKTGLDMSFLERLMQSKMYRPNQEGDYNKRIVSQLLNNYRSHPAILKIPNDLFYNSKLRPKADIHMVNSLCKLNLLPKKGFPLIFHAVLGEDRKETSSPSFYNPDEIEEVISYVKKLLQPNNKKDEKVLPKEIGIITPYKLQVHKIRQALQKLEPSSRNDIKVGSVEDFQGEERRVILISTVRANKHQLAKDEVFKLGFLNNPKRFNVAVTRAQALLIIVGCPTVLQLDRNWLVMIKYIKEKGGYVGQSVPAPLENIDSILHETELLDLTPIGLDISERQRVEAPAFQSY